MANNRKERPNTRTFITETTDFAEGYSSIMKLVPELTVYAEPGKSSVGEVMTSLISTISDDLPTTDNENYPNTLSLYLSAKEVAFLTDNGIAFGWRIFNNIKKGPKYVYQFRITFISLSMTKRRYIDNLIKGGWKERDLSEKQSRFWNDVSRKQGIPDQHESRRRNTQDRPSADHNEHVVQAQTGESKQANVDYNRNANGSGGELRREEVVSAPTNSDDTGVHSSDNDIAITDSNSSEVHTGGDDIGNRSEYTGRDEAEATSNANENSHSVFMMDHEDSTPSSQITFEGQEEENAKIAAREAARSQCTIMMGKNPATFVINHYGQMIEVNINNKNEGIMVDRGSRNIVIDDAVYNYGSFKVNFLDEPRVIENATFLPSQTDKMRRNVKLDDSAFVGKKALEELYESGGPDLGNFKLQNSSEVIIAGKNPVPGNFNKINTGKAGVKSILGAGRNLVIDRRTPIPESTPAVDRNGVAMQSIRMSNEAMGAPQ